MAGNLTSDSERGREGVREQPVFFGIKFPGEGCGGLGWVAGGGGIEREREREREKVREGERGRKSTASL